ncbi:hypothetical protein ACHWQZ_G006341 [Mnemiopsis leidyi]
MDGILISQLVKTLLLQQVHKTLSKTLGQTRSKFLTLRFVYKSSPSIYIEAISQYCKTSKMLFVVLLWARLCMTWATHTSYHVDVLLYNKDHAGCDNCVIYANVLSQRDKLGRTYSASLGRLDKPQHNEFRKNEWDYFHVKGNDIGIIQCIELISKSKDAILVQEVVVTSVSHPQPIHLYNTAGHWLSSQENNGLPLKLCAQGVEVYFISTKVARKNDAASDRIHLRAKIEGEETSTETGYFNNPRSYDFRSQNAEDTFVFRDLQSVHGVKCITLKAGGSDKLILEWIKVEPSTQPTVLFRNAGYTALSSDRNKGTNSLKLCN